jgi:hypothetical protein
VIKMNEDEELLRLVEEARSSFEHRLKTTEDKDEKPYLKHWIDIANKHIVKITFKMVHK